MLVTLHLAAGQTAKQLMAGIAELSGGAPPRTVSGRFGVLVDAELAYRYLAARYAPPVPPPAPEPAQPVARTEPAAVAVPGKKAPAKKAAPRAAPKATTAKGE
jgi:hypothetical protein